MAAARMISPVVRLPSNNPTRIRHSRRCACIISSISSVVGWGFGMQPCSPLTRRNNRFSLIASARPRVPHGNNEPGMLRFHIVITGRFVWNPGHAFGRKSASTLVGANQICFRQCMSARHIENILGVAGRRNRELLSVQRE